MKSSVAFVFPGQGSQSIGMLQALASRHPLVSSLFDSVSERLGYDLWALIQNGPEAQLNQTEQTQAAMLTADVAVYRVLEQQVLLKPHLMAGHSLGEYAALVCADAIPLVDAAELVAHRGRIMQNEVPLGIGGMAVIVGMEDEQVAQLCAKASTASEVVSPANYNAIGQMVIAGHQPAVSRAIALAEEAGARMARIIPVSVPCHCSLLNAAAEVFETYLEKAPFSTPRVPVISNVDLSYYNSPDHIRRLLKAQLYSPVRWVETVQKMKNEGIDTLIECGPGKVLSGLAKRIDKSLNTFSVNDPPSLETTISECLAFSDKGKTHE